MGLQAVDARIQAKSLHMGGALGPGASVHRVSGEPPVHHGGSDDLGNLSLPCWTALCVNFRRFGA